MMNKFLIAATLIALPALAAAEPRCAVPEPKYPAVAKREWIQGTAVVDIKVNAQGAVEAVKLVKSAGESLLDAAAVEAAQRAQCAPGRPEALTQPFSFEMKRSYL